MRRRLRSATSCSASAARKRACRPALLVGLGGEISPDQLDGGKSQLGQNEREAGGVDGIGRLHAALPARS
jgi:hypothetical protein